MGKGVYIWLNNELEERVRKDAEKAGESSLSRHILCILKEHYGVSK